MNPNRSDEEGDSKSSPSLKEASKPKRAQRQRHPVVLLQHNYFEMYDDKNNRAGKRKKPSDKESPVSAPAPPKQSSNAMNTKKRKISNVSSTDKKSSKTQSSSASIDSNSNSSTKPKSVYRWVGAPLNTRSNDQSKNKFYEKIELNVGNHPALVKVGDYVLVSSSDYEEDQLHDKPMNEVTMQSPVNTESRSTIVRDMMRGSDDDDEVLDSTLKSEEKMEVAMNSLDPYVGRVEEMWEEPKSNQQGNDRPYSAMKYRVRWFYKESDVLSLRGQFVGVSRSNLASALTPRDILLGEQTDENEISTIIGKCKVLRLKPETQMPSIKRSSNRLSKQQGAYYSRFNINIIPPSKSKGKGKIIIIPYDGPDDMEEEDVIDEPPTKKLKTETKTKEGIETNSTPKNDFSSVDEVDDDSSLSVADRRNRKKPSITEGNATLKIKVGEEHQAVIPVQMNKRRYLPKRETPIKVWKPQSISDAKLHSYFTEAEDILKEYMKKNGYDMTRSLPHNIPKEFSVSSSEGRLSSHCAYREFNVDDLIYLLHDHNYNTVSALKGLKKYPEEYLFIWTKEDKALYNVGFQNHASNLHLISKNVAVATADKVVHKDVVDYHYRFKIPDQFKRFQDLKREQARRMLEAGVRLRLNEFLSYGLGYQNGNGSTNGMKKSLQWAKNGGVPGEIGDVEARRLGCKKFLFEVREAVGEEKYLTLVNLLKSLHAKVLTIPQLKDGFASVLSENPKLMSQFETYLPVMFRSSKT